MARFSLCAHVASLDERQKIAIFPRKTIVVSFPSLFLTSNRNRESFVSIHIPTSFVKLRQSSTAAESVGSPGPPAPASFLDVNIPYMAQSDPQPLAQIVGCQSGTYYLPCSSISSSHMFLISGILHLCLPLNWYQKRHFQNYWW